MTHKNKVDVIVINKLLVFNIIIELILRACFFFAFIIFYIIIGFSGTFEASIFTYMLISIILVFYPPKITFLKKTWKFKLPLYLLIIICLTIELVDLENKIIFYSYDVYILVSLILGFIYDGLKIKKVKRG